MPATVIATAIAVPAAPAIGAPRVVARRYPLLLALICIVAAAASIVVARGAIADWRFFDPDDQMRLQQVRDLLGGQSWFDVTQYRMNPPFGAPMHWSRLIDLPIAGVILLLRPLLGPAHAEVAAVVAVPMLTLASAMAASASLARRLWSREAGLAAAALAPLTVSALQQMRPMRIDHHGWQVVIAVLIARALLIRDGARAGTIAGALAALWLAISLEGLPLAAAAGALVAVRWLIDPAEGRARFERFALALGGTGIALFALTRSGAAWRVPACDAVSPVHLAVFAVVACGTPLVTRFGAGALPRRLLALGALGIACAGAYGGVGPRCLSGAFAELDPLVAKYWYDNVLEGLPLWRQTPQVAIADIGYPLIALAGAALGRGRAMGSARADWAVYIVLLAAATLATLCVQRSAAFSNMLALPGAIVLMRDGFARAQRVRQMLPRVLASAGVLVALLPTAPALAASAVATLADRAPAKAAVDEAHACATAANFESAGRLPHGILFTNIDIGPGVLLATSQTVVASAHHRNQAAIRDVLATFLGTAADARAILRRRGARYIVVCADMDEMDLYRRLAPHGFWAGLAAGRTPGWLRRVAIPGSQLAVWEVTGWRSIRDLDAVRRNRTRP